jgi:hypothetical protein
MRDNPLGEGATLCPTAGADVRGGEYPAETETASETNDVDNSIMISGGVIAANLPQAVRNLSLSAAVTSDSFSLFFIAKLFHNNANGNAFVGRCPRWRVLRQIGSPRRGVGVDKHHILKGILFSA